ncbi:MAG: ABC transporter substrate-binding protein [Chloroflexi bacterium]|nr:MAG: ABC transporter substrate-binding protein [Chloroflexota bacterium]
MLNIMKPPTPKPSAPPVPDYARAPGYSQLPRKSSHWVWMTLGILALVCTLGAALLAFGLGIAINTYGSPTIASDQYYTAIKNQDDAAAYSYLGSHLKTVYSQQAFTQLAQQQDAIEGRVSHYAYANTPTGDPATVILTVTRANGTPYTVHLQMRQEAGTWKVTAFDRV